MAVIPKSVMALDVGAKRIGVALASWEARLPHPMTTLAWDNEFFPALQALIAAEHVGELVVGLPRGLSGQHTDQTRAVEAFIAELRAQVDLPVHLQDEALTSRQAETELASRGKPYRPGDIDALAATYILADFLTENQEPAV